MGALGPDRLVDRFRACFFLRRTMAHPESFVGLEEAEIGYCCRADSAASTAAKCESESERGSLGQPSGSDGLLA